MPRKPTTRNRSLRAYRRQADVLLKQAERGEISWPEARSGIFAIKAAGEMLLTENLMEAQGIHDGEPVHPSGQDGGLDEYAPHKKARRVKIRTLAKKTSDTPKGEFTEESEKIVQ